MEIGASGPRSRAKRPEFHANPFKIKWNLKAWRGTRGGWPRIFPKPHEIRKILARSILLAEFNVFAVTCIFYVGQIIV